MIFDISRIFGKSGFPRLGLWVIFSPARADASRDFVAAMFVDTDFRPLDDLVITENLAGGHKIWNSGFTTFLFRFPGFNIFFGFL